MHTILYLLIFINLLQFNNCYTHLYDESIFGGKEQYCNLECFGKKHTLCKDMKMALANREACGKEYLLFEMGPFSDNRQDIMNGHNGIRNRIAYHMKVANMKVLRWDEELAQMAENWLTKCKPYEIDPCTQANVTNYTETITHMSYKAVNQNVYFVRRSFLPPNYIIKVIRKWYMEKNNMKPPLLEIRGSRNTTEGYFENNLVNNFTQLAHPHTSRVGCAFARHSGGYELICNYHPYIHNSTFRYGIGASFCPNFFPLQSTQFEYLCSNNSTRISCNCYLLAIIIFLLSVLV